MKAAAEAAAREAAERQAQEELAAAEQVRLLAAKMAAEKLATDQLAEEEARAQAEKEAQRKAGVPCTTTPPSAPSPPPPCTLSAVTFVYFGVKQMTLLVSGVLSQIVRLVCRPSLQGTMTIFVVPPPPRAPKPPPFSLLLCCHEPRGSLDDSYASGLPFLVLCTKCC